MDKAEQFLKEHHIHTLGGKDDFEEEFSGYKWSATVIQQPDLLEEYVRLIGLIGATIQNMEVVEYPCLFGLISPDVWTLEWDNVMVLMTDRGNFEIAYRESSSFCISQNCIPERFYCKAKTEAMDSVKKLFSCLKGDTITDISTKSSSFNYADNEFTGSWGIGLEENLSSYLRECCLILKSGRYLSLTSDFDWGIISLYDKDDQLVHLV